MPRGSQAQLLRHIAASRCFLVCLCPAWQDRAWRGPEQIWRRRTEANAGAVWSPREKMKWDGPQIRPFLVTPSLPSCQPFFLPSFCALSIPAPRCLLFLLNNGPVLTLPSVSVHEILYRFQCSCPSSLLQALLQHAHPDGAAPPGTLLTVLVCASLPCVLALLTSSPFHARLPARARGRGFLTVLKCLPSWHRDLREGSLWVRVSGHKADPRLLPLTPPGATEPCQHPQRRSRWPDSVPSLSGSRTTGARATQVSGTWLSYCVLNQAPVAGPLARGCVPAPHGPVQSQALCHHEPQ